MNDVTFPHQNSFRQGNVYHFPDDRYYIGTIRERADGQLQRQGPGIETATLSSRIEGDFYVDAAGTPSAQQPVFHQGDGSQLTAATASLDRGMWIPTAGVRTRRSYPGGAYVEGELGVANVEGLRAQGVTVTELRNDAVYHAADGMEFRGDLLEEVGGEWLPLGEGTLTFPDRRTITGEFVQAAGGGQAFQPVPPFGERFTMSRAAVNNGTLTRPDGSTWHGRLDYREGGWAQTEETTWVTRLRDALLPFPIER